MRDVLRSDNYYRLPSARMLPMLTSTWPRLTRHLNKFNLINPFQHGFLKGKSTESAIAEFTSHIHLTLEKNIQAVCLFLDLSKTFGTVDHEILLNKLEAVGIRGLVRNWFKSYLSDKMQVVETELLNSHSFREIYHSDTKKINIPAGKFQRDRCTPRQCPWTSLIPHLHKLSYSQYNMLGQKGVENGFGVVKVRSRMWLDLVGAIRRRGNVKLIVDSADLGVAGCTLGLNLRADDSGDLCPVGCFSKE
ncbi:hypothetical protein PR048_025614 [Dryococelus australis]|uniref:Reverse transcriptase domain-containing protein n=1 Tax=Dryococelus australis TaxID=614101 RepID=A0ABQ9GRV4_9NEOP|nr:hypothetical protein PR048_025614 [Dryococelus australis]